MKINRFLELFAAFFSAISGLTASAALAPSPPFFISNFLFYWLPQACVFVLISIYKPPRPAAYAGVAVALTVYFILFHSWVFSHKTPDSMAWLGYLASFPGAVVGAFVALAYLASRQIRQALFVGLYCTLGVAIGIAINQLIVCITVLYCGGK